MNLSDEILQSMARAAPLIEWLKGAIAFKDVLLFLGMVSVVWLLRRERRKIGGFIVDLSERVETMTQLAKAARADFETAMVRPSGPASMDSAANWAAVQSIWRETRDRIELAIEQISDRRIKPKYSKIARYNYNEVIIMLRDDGLIPTDRAFAALVGMNGLFQRLKLRPGAVTQHEVNQFRQLWRDLNGALPKLPKSKSSGPSPAPLRVAAE